MKPNTAKAYRAACSQILRVLDDWEAVDVGTLDLDDVFQRFQNKRSKDFTPESLDTYRKRFTTARNSFIRYISNPSAWKMPIKNREARLASRQNISAVPLPVVRVENSVTTDDVSSDAASVRQGFASADQASQFVDYPFPLRENMIAHLRLPADLQVREVKRLSAFLASLAVNAE